ncbi:uncharacterized protein [Malus domestica]|uniref:uncharacterized protein n=1 Tax=Malus domestica TaxID=3750 RepID=UPI003975205E
MALEIPMDVIKQVQISLREEAELSSYDPEKIVDLPVRANELNRAQTARNDELSLSDLLNLEIKWTSKREKIETDLPNEIPNLLKLPDLAGVNLDNFFFEERKMVLRTTEGESGDSGWAASFQFAASESQASETLPLASEILPRASESLSQASESLYQASESLSQASESLPQESKSLDAFVGSTVDFSARIGTVFGSVVDSMNEKSNHSVTGSASSDWFQDDLLGVSNSGFSGEPERLEILAEVKGGIAENVNNSFPDGVDWVQDNQLQITSNKDLDGNVSIPCVQPMMKDIKGPTHYKG